MKVGIVCPYSFDTPGGVQNHVKDLAEALVLRGHDVSVLAPGEDDDVAPYVVLAGGPAEHLQRRWPGCRSARSSRTGAPLAQGGPVRRAAPARAGYPEHRAARAGPRSARWSPPSTPPTCARGRCRRRRRSCARRSRSPAGSRLGVRPDLVHHIGGEPVVIPDGVYVDHYARAEPREEWRGRRARWPSSAGSTSPQGLRAARRGLRRRPPTGAACGCWWSAAGSSAPGPACLRRSTARSSSSDAPPTPTRPRRCAPHEHVAPTPVASPSGCVGEAMAAGATVLASDSRLRAGPRPRSLRRAVPLRGRGRPHRSARVAARRP